MTYYANNAEAGANGVTITTGNSADNGAGNALSIATGGTLQYSTAWARGGTRSWYTSAAAGATALLGWSGGVSTESAFRIYFRVTALPSATCAIVQGRYASGSIFEAQIQSNGKMRFADQGGANSYVTTATLSTNTTYRLEVRLDVGTTTSNGFAQFAIYAGESTTPIETQSVSTWNLGTTAVASWRWGKVTSAGVAYDVYFDDAAYDDGGTALIGPEAGTAEVIYSTQRVVEVNTTGSTGTLSLTQTAGTTATITGPVSGVYRIILPSSHSDVLRFDLTATASGAPDVVEVLVPPDNLSNELVYTGVGSASLLSSWA